MRQPFARSWSVLQVTRLATATSAVADIWLVALWSRLVERRLPGGIEALSELLLWCAGVGVGMYVFGSTLNDVLDARRDRLFSPHRPIPARHISQAHTLVISLCALLLAIFCAMPLGTRSMTTCLICAALIVFYNAIGKHLPAIGVLTLALIRAANMLIADPGIDFLWPVWLNMTHVMFTAALAYRLGRKRPYLAPQELWALSAGWVFWTLLMIFWMSDRSAGRQDMPWLWMGPIVSGLIALPLGVWLLQRAPNDRTAASWIGHAAVVWLIVYDGSWFVTSGLWWAAAMMGWLLVITLIGLWLTRRLRTGAQRSSTYQADRPRTI
jgi:hypothetical protein